MIYLYIKTHNVTGLKYLGKTIQNPHVYRGSGKRWKAHIEKHGYDVTTEVVGVFDTIEELRSVSIPLSEELGIVSSTTWANLRPEAGDGGDTSVYIDYSSLNRGKGLTYEQRYGKSKADELRQMRADQFSKNRKGKSWDELFGKQYADARRKKMSERRRVEIGRVTSEETKAKLRAKAVGRSPAICCCTICGKVVPINNITQHFGKYHPPSGKSQR